MASSNVPPSRVVKQLFQLVVARADIERMKKAVSLLLESDDAAEPDLYRALSDAAVVAYGRPFTNNNPYGSLPSRYGRFDDAELREAHNELRRFRNAVVAHSEASHQDVRIEVVRGRVAATTHAGMRAVPGHLDVLQRLATTQIDRLTAAINTLLGQIDDASSSFTGVLRLDLKAGD